MQDQLQQHLLYPADQHFRKGYAIMTRLKSTTVTLLASIAMVLSANSIAEAKKPVMIINLLESIEILSRGITSFVNNCLIGLKVNEKTIHEELEQSLMVVTNLTPIIGYEKAGEIAQRAFITGKTIKEIVKEMKLDIEDIELEIPSNPEFGDYAFPCFKLSKIFKKSPSIICL